MSDNVFASPAVGDVNNDGRLEVVANDISASFYVFGPQGQALQQGGARTQLASPSLGDTNGDGNIDIVYQAMNTAALGDFDRDGLVEIATEGGVQRTGAKYKPGKFPWPMFRHDARRSGNYGNPPPLPPKPNYETYILLVNPGGKPASVTLSFAA